MPSSCERKKFLTLSLMDTKILTDLQLMKLKVHKIFWPVTLTMLP